MRILLLILLMGVSAPAARAQAPEATAEAAGEPRAASEAGEKRMDDREARVLLLAPLRTASTDELKPLRREREPAAAASQGRGEDFLWQILLTAVSALVTALIWKAVS